MDSTQEAANLAQIRTYRLTVWLVVIGVATLIVCAISAYFAAPSQGGAVMVKGWIPVFLLVGSAIGICIALLIVAHRLRKYNGGRKEFSLAGQKEIQQLKDANASLLKEKQRVETKLAEVQLEYAKSKPDTQIIKPPSIMPCGESLLHSLAEKDRYWIDKAVKIVTIDPQPDGLTSGAPYIEFPITVYNLSAFPVSIDDSIEGYISYRERNRPEKKLDLHKTLDTQGAKNIPSRGLGTFTITQEIIQTQGELFWSKPDDITFSLDHLTIKIKGANDSDRIITQELETRNKPCRTNNRYLYYEPEAAIAYGKLPFVEVARLKAELEAERQKTKPDIGGEIREVLFEKEINLATSLVISEDCYFYYWFYVRLYVVNLGTATTVERYRLILRTKEGVHEGQRLLLAGYSFDDAIDEKLVDKNLVDIEDQNDVALEHTRNGWICFGVPSIKSNRDDGAVEDMQIEIQVIDKAKTQHSLGRSAQAEWRENSQHRWPRIQPARTNRHNR
jgi:hypothetical protein